MKNGRILSELNQIWTISAAGSVGRLLEEHKLWWQDSRVQNQRPCAKTYIEKERQRKAKYGQASTDSERKK